MTLLYLAKKHNYKENQEMITDPTSSRSFLFSFQYLIIEFAPIPVTIVTDSLHHS